MKCNKCRNDIPEESVYCMYCGRLQKSVPKPPHRRGNDQGTAYKRGNTWTAKWTVATFTDNEGNYIQERKTKGGFKSKKEAQDYCSSKKYDTEKSVPPLMDYWLQYESSRLKELSKDKQTAYRIAWKRWDALKHYRVDRITTGDLQRVVDEKTESFYPARDMRSVMANLYKLIGADGFASKDLPSYIHLPKNEETKREPFSDTEQAALWKAWESGCEEAAIPLVMIYTGMMPAEMMALTNDMIRFDTKQIIGVGHKTAVRKAAPVYFPDAILPVLQRVIESEKENKRKQPFPKSEEKFYESYYTALSMAGTRRLTPYSCRHTTATALAITEGIAPQTIKQIMRWSTTRMLDRYAHPNDESISAAINVLTQKESG